MKRLVLVALLALASPLVAQAPTRAQLDSVRAEFVRARAFNRSAETTFTRAIARLDTLLARMTQAPVPPPPLPDSTPTPPPPTGQLAGWFSDWATQAANLGHVESAELHDRLADRVSGTNKWSGGVSRRIHQEVVTAPSSAPFAKWVEFEIQGPNTNSGQTEIIKSDLPVIAPDQTQTWRWYESYEQPGNVGATNNHHGIGAKFPGGGEFWTQDASYDTRDERFWVDFFAVPGEGGGVNRKFGVWTDCNIGQGSNNCATQFRYTKGALYMKVVQVRRIGSTNTFRMKIWTYTVGPTGVHTLLHGPADYRNENGSLSLADNPVLNGNVSLTAGFTIGSNGISGTFPTPLPFMHIGGVAVVYGLPEGTPVGAYGTVQGETPR